MYTFHAMPIPWSMFFFSKWLICPKKLKSFKGPTKLIIYNQLHCPKSEIFFNFQRIHILDEIIYIIR